WVAPLIRSNDVIPAIGGRAQARGDRGDLVRDYLCPPGMIERAVFLYERIDAEHSTVHDHEHDEQCGKQRVQQTAHQGMVSHATTLRFHHDGGHPLSLSAPFTRYSSIVGRPTANTPPDAVGSTFNDAAPGAAASNSTLTKRASVRLANTRRTILESS